MSFALTTEQILNRTKTVTRRINWTFLKPGEIIVEDAKGFKTPVYVLKRKLVEAIYGITVREV